MFVLAPPQPATVTLTSQSPSLALTEADQTGAWYVQSALNPSLPSLLTVVADNQPAIPASTPTTASLPLTDLVSIERAEYSLGSGQLTVVASTSDEITPPTLTARTGQGAVIGTLGNEGAQKTLTTGLSPIPPATVTVTSSNGGSDSEEVVILP